VVVAPPPPIPGRPFSRGDCDFNSPLGALRCYNPSDVAVQLTAALNSVDCGTHYGAQTVTIQPKTNGYFTLPSVACGQTAQVEMYFGSRQGSCRNPDFSSQRTYAGPACAPPPPPPPPPPPVCTDPAWGPWTAAIAPAVRCTTERRQRTLCSGEIQVEFRQVCQ
jgi:hypothetical protein